MQRQSSAVAVLLILLAIPLSGCLGEDGFSPVDEASNTHWLPPVEERYDLQYQNRAYGQPYLLYFMC